MRGDDNQQEAMFSYISPEKRVPADHPLRFVYEAEQDRYICPAGKPLLYEGHDQHGGISYLKYEAAVED